MRSTCTLVATATMHFEVRLVLTSGMAAGEVGLVAVHGTGTPLGDPIEVGALGQALNGSEASARGSRKVVIASVKSCYGHTEGAAGLTGALLSVQLLQSQVLPAFNPAYNWECHSKGMSNSWLQVHRVTCLVLQRSEAALLWTTGAICRSSASRLLCRLPHPF